MNSLLSSCCLFQNGWTPLHLAASTGNANAVRVLLENGANIEAKNSVSKSAENDNVTRCLEVLEVL